MCSSCLPSTAHPWWVLLSSLFAGQLIYLALQCTKVPAPGIRTTQAKFQSDFSSSIYSRYIPNTLSHLWPGHNQASRLILEGFICPNYWGLIGIFTAEKYFPRCSERNKRILSSWNIVQLIAKRIIHLFCNTNFFRSSASLILTYKSHSLFFIEKMF